MQQPLELLEVRTGRDVGHEVLHFLVIQRVAGDDQRVRRSGQTVRVFAKEVGVLDLPDDRTFFRVLDVESLPPLSGEDLRVFSQLTHFAGPRRGHGQTRETPMFSGLPQLPRRGAKQEARGANPAGKVAGHLGHVGLPQGAVPQPARPEAEHPQRSVIHGNAVIAKMSPNHRLQPLSHRRNRVVPAMPKLGFDLAQLRLQPLPHRLPKDREPPVAPLLPAEVRKAEEAEGLRLAPTATPAVFGRERPGLQQAGLVGMQFQLELAESFRQIGPEPLGIRLLLESNDEVIRIAHDDHVAACIPSTPLLDPEVEHVVQVDVGRQRRCTAALGRSRFATSSRPILQHAGVQPSLRGSGQVLDKPHDAPVRDAVLDELHQPSVPSPLRARVDGL